MPKVSTEHKEQVRQRLLDAARRVVLRDGHEGATTRAILEEAGLSAGSLYNYFSSKDELFEVLAEEIISENVRAFALAGEPHGDTLVRFAAELLTEPDLPALAWFRGRLSADPDVRAAITNFNQAVVESFEPLVAAAQADGTIDDDIDGAALIELFDVIVEGLNRRQVMGAFVTDFDRVGRLAIDVLLRAIVNERASSS
ncbi:MAG: TetR/AcrR family transcriptional regulator, transcriptional repressor of aconitase [Acidimicrobiaceae bacterium]|nr:TetR/AcrR family transcriptional regulator, transcriptional repressor of aconitase [Acidimicrobiaceae bacterium]